MDLETVHLLCSEGLKKSRDDLTITEITKKTLASSTSGHRIHSDLINDYFLPYGEYPHLK